MKPRFETPICRNQIQHGSHPLRRAGMDELLPGMNVDGVIILDQASDVLAVPADALMRGNKVYVKYDTVTEAQGMVPAGFRAVDVKTGLISDDYVEITEGLSEGDVVYVAESTVSSSFKMMINMMRVAIPSTLQQSIVHIGMLLVQSVVNVFGSAVMAGFAAGTRIESICIVPMLAIGNAMSTFTAQNIGAGRPDRVKQGYRYCYAMVGFFAVVICIIMQLWGDLFIRGFLNEGSAETAFQTGMAYVRFISFFFVFIGLKATTDGLLRGAGDVVVFTIANLVNLAIRVIVAAVFAPIIGVQAVWYAVPMGWAANYIISFMRYLTGKWSRVHLISGK